MDEVMNKVNLAPLIAFVVFCLVWSSCERNGVRKTYYDNGKAKSIAEMKDGVMHGTHEFYYPSGVLQSRGYYFMGKANGLIEHFYESGALKSKANWLNGEENGEALVYFENGTLQFSAHYRDGKIHGISRVFYKDGKIRERKLYDSLGNLTHITVFQPDGTLQKCFVVPSITASKDTVTSGEEVLVKIKFPFRMAGDIYIQASETDSAGNVFYEPEILKRHSDDSVLYRRIFNSSGKYKLSFEFDHTNINDEDTLNVKGVIRDYDIVVLKSPVSRES